MTRVVTYAPDVESFGLAVVSIGVFDGVHIGHQALVSDACALAQERHALSAVVTFDRDPDRVVAPGRAAPQLLELTDKLDFLADLGPDVLLVVPFTPETAALTPGDFLGEVLLAAFTPAGVIVGHDFRFGSHASGDLSTLEEYGRTHSFEVIGHRLVRVEGEPVTSTRIRSHVLDGDVTSAARLLGRPHRVRGTVVAGRGEGRGLGARTANVDVPSYAALPADGVYAGRVRLDGVAYGAAISVGVPPTFPTAACNLEVHVLGFEGDLYGREIAVEFLERLRDQRRFSDTAELAAAIAADVARVRELVGEA